MTDLSWLASERKRMHDELDELLDNSTIAMIVGSSAEGFRYVTSTSNRERKHGTISASALIGGLEYIKQTLVLQMMDDDE